MSIKFSYALKLILSCFPYPSFSTRPNTLLASASVSVKESRRRVYVINYYMSQSCKPLCGNHEIYCITSRKKTHCFSKIRRWLRKVMLLCTAMCGICCTWHCSLRKPRLYLLFQLTFQYDWKWIIIWLRNISLNLGHFWNHTKVYNYHYIVTC